MAGKCFLMAAFQEKDVPLRTVSAPAKADYTLDSTISNARGHRGQIDREVGPGFGGHEAEGYQNR
jgi:hypothetical protein